MKESREVVSQSMATPQELRALFLKAYPSGKKGSEEADTMGKAALASQFTAGLLPEIRAIKARLLLN